MKDQELLYRLAITLLPGIGNVGANKLLRAAGNATVLFEHSNELEDIVPDVSPKLKDVFDCPDTLRLCEAELNFADS